MAASRGKLRLPGVYSRPPHTRPLLPGAAALQVGMGQMECYEKDFEEYMLKDTAEYYRRKAAVWIQVKGRYGGS